MNHADRADKPETARGTAENPVHIRDPDLGKWSRRLVYWTGALVFATAVSGGISLLQWWELKVGGNQTQAMVTNLGRQADAMQAQLVARMTYDVDRRPTPDGWAVTTRWQNTGQTEAIDFVGWKDFDVVRGKDAIGRLANFDFSKRLHTERTFSPARDFIPGEGMTFETDTIAKADALEAIAGATWVISWGPGDYKDYLGVEYKVNYCFVFTFGQQSDVIAIGLPHILFPSCNSRVHFPPQRNKTNQ